MITVVAFLFAVGLCLLAWSLFATAIRNILPMLACGAAGWAAWGTTQTLATSALIAVLVMLGIATLLELASRTKSLRFPVMLVEALTASVIVGALAWSINSGSAVDASTASFFIGASAALAGLIVYRKHALD